MFNVVTMKIYLFNPTTKEYTGEDETELDPLETENAGKPVYLMPPNATLLEPTKKLGHVPVWDGEAWVPTPDYRGVHYWLSTDTYQSSPSVMNDLGPLPKGATRTRPQPSAEEQAAIDLMKAKDTRAATVAALTVTVDGMAFDADEMSQARMAVAASTMTDDETNVWVLANNQPVLVTKAQLMEAGRKARIAQSAVWTKPYEAA